MKILMVNKFLFPKGGAETYMLRLGEQLVELGHQVAYFGMDDSAKTVGNRWNLYTTPMDFHQCSTFQKATYLTRIVYSREARQKMYQLLTLFRPDVVHLNNFNFQLTPSVLLAAEEYRKQENPKLRILYTAHDYQLVCPNHLLFDPQKYQICEKCLGGNLSECVKNKCIHGSQARSFMGAAENLYWNSRKVYRILDAILCPSRFMKQKLDGHPDLAEKTIFLRNFVAAPKLAAAESRLCALLILVERYKKHPEETVRFYLSHTQGINNWDLVDLSAPYILGRHLTGSADREVLYTLAGSDNMWEQRIAVVSTLALIRDNQFEDTMRLAGMFLDTRHDLMHKAVGWMLREVGKRDERTLTDFLDKHCLQMPRIMLRYSIEKFSPARRAHYMRRPC